MNSPKLRLALLLYVLLVIVVSLWPHSGGGVSWPHMDKVGHFFTYLGLAVLALLNFDGAARRIGALVGAVALGALLEWGQSFVPGRDMSAVDGIVNALGVLTGAWLFRVRGARLRGWVQSLLDRL